MAFDRALLSEKLKKYRNQFQLSLTQLSEATGIDKEALSAYENQERMPSGDEILILSDYYKCDYKFFISNEILAPFEQTETLFRRHGDDFSQQDRWAIQEFLYLAECESYLDSGLHKNTFNFIKTGSHHKRNGIKAAGELRKHFNYSSIAIPMDVYADFRRIGIRTYRRKLNNSNISGLYIKHPVAGKCILINYSEDIYRQRFTAAHEAAHAILNDDEQGVLVSFKGSYRDYVEIGADNFASHYLMPPEFLRQIPQAKNWNRDRALKWANELKVSTEALAYALKNAKLIDKATEGIIKSVRVDSASKVDPEISADLSSSALTRKKHLLERGLSTFYVNLCFQSYRENIITASRMAEMLLVELSELFEIADLYGEEY